MATVNAVTAFSQRCVKALNEQIAMELNAFHAYRAIAYCFSRHDVALKNIATRFNAMAMEELEHANILSRYVQMRGGEVAFTAIENPAVSATMSLLQAFEHALVMEKAVHASLKKVHACAVAEDEAACAGFLEDEFLAEQVTAEHELMEIIATVKRMGAGLGEALFDQQMK